MEPSVFRKWNLPCNKESNNVPTVFFILISWPPSLTLLPYLWAVAMYASIQMIDPDPGFGCLTCTVAYSMIVVTLFCWHCFARVSWLPRIASFLSQAFVMNQLLRTSLVFLKKSYSPHKDYPDLPAEWWTVWGVDLYPRRHSLSSSLGMTCGLSGFSGYWFPRVSRRYKSVCKHVSLRNGFLVQV